LQSLDSDAVDDVDAGCAGGIYQQPIKHVPPGCVQRLDTIARRDGYRDRLVTIEESRLTHGRRVGCDDGRQDVPSM
jgi:hypothetical protein